MPGGDGTGPVGQGPMTGRATGFCAGNSVPGYTNAVGGRRFWARGRGGGRGWRNWFGLARPRAGYRRLGYGGVVPFAQGLTVEQEVKGLKGQAEFLQNNLSQVSERIEQLEKESKK